MKHSRCTHRQSRHLLVSAASTFSETTALIETTTTSDRSSCKLCLAASLVVRYVVALFVCVVFTNETMAQGGGMSSEAIRDTANRVMESQDYRGVRRRVLENVAPQDAGSSGFLTGPIESMGNAVGDFFEWLFQGLFSGGPNRPAARPVTRTPATGSGGLNFSLGSLFLYLGFAVLIGIAIWFIAALVQKSDPNRSVDRSFLGSDEDITDLKTPPGELAASTYESRAIQMAADGNYKAAVRELLIGGMSWIERAGLIRFRKGLTNRDYVRAVWKQSEKRQAYINTATEFERIYFGRRDANRDTFENCLRSFQGSFREEETSTAAV